MSTDLDIRCITLHTRNRTPEAHKLRHAALRDDVERQRLARIAKLKADEDALHLQPSSFLRDALRATGFVCGAAGIVAVIWVLLAGVFLI